MIYLYVYTYEIRLGQDISQYYKCGQSLAHLDMCLYLISQQELNLSLALSLSIYMCTYIYVCIKLCVYMYIYIERERETGKVTQTDEER